MDNIGEIDHKEDALDYIQYKGNDNDFNEIFVKNTVYEIKNINPNYLAKIS